MKSPVDQVVHFRKVQFKMPGVGFDVFTKRYQRVFTADPLGFKLFWIHISDNMDQVQVDKLPQLNQLAPIFVLVILDGDPPVVVAIGGIIW